MPNPIVNIRSVFSGVINYDPDALAYFAQLTGTIPNSYKIAVNNFILTMKSDGNWTKFDRIWIHAAPNQQNATISVVNSTSTAITENNSPTWTQNQGYTGNATNMYLNTNYTPSSSAVNYTQDNACYGFYSRTNSVGNYIDMACYDGTQWSELYPRFTGDAVLTAINGATDSTSASTDSTGLYIVQRVLSTRVQLWRNNNNEFTPPGAVNNSVGLPTRPFFILARNLSGVADSFSNRQIAFSFIGAGNIDTTAFYNAVTTLRTAIGF